MADYEQRSKCDGRGWVPHPEGDKPGKPDHIKCNGEGIL
jgi:hypothetical protein